jgi:hypothetical protein
MLTGENGAVRRTIVMTLIAAAAVVGMVVAFSAPTADPVGPKPPQVEAVFPQGGDLDLRQSTIVADLAPGYTGYLALDGVEVPDDDLQRVDALNTVTLKPLEGSDYEQLAPGRHCATVFYWRVGQTRDEASSFRWCFNLH